MSAGNIQQKSLSNSERDDRKEEESSTLLWGKGKQGKKEHPNALGKRKEA